MLNCWLGANMGIFKSNSDIKLNLPNYLKISLLIIASSFLAYSLYWTVFSVFWIYNVTINITTLFRIVNISSNLQQNIIIIQEYAASAGYFLALIGAIFAVQCAVLFIKNNEKYLDRLSKTLLFEALFFLMLIPSSIQHLLGFVLSWTNVDIYVGLSFLLQALLIAPTVIILSISIRKPQNQSILKWITISAPSVVLGFWFKYLFFWLGTLSPMGPKQANLVSIIGAVNSFVTLLIAGIITSLACLVLYRKRRINTSLVGIVLILFGSHFIIYDLVSIWVPIYRSFLYISDFWMIVLPILGIAVLKVKSFNLNTADH
jgi:hypothetical protein